MINFAFETNFTHSNCLVTFFFCFAFFVVFVLFWGDGVVLGIVMKRIYLNCNLSKRSLDDPPCGTIDLLLSLNKTKKKVKKNYI